MTITFSFDSIDIYWRELSKMCLLPPYGVRSTHFIEEAGVAPSRMFLNIHKLGDDVCTLVESPESSRTIPINVFPPQRLHLLRQLMAASPIGLFENLEDEGIR